MTTRTATCQCGQLTATVTGEPVRISACHCHDCQRRSGAPFALQARFASGQVLFTGEAKVWLRTADSGEQADQHFCPNCGSTLWYCCRPDRDLIAIPVGAFTDPDFPAPSFSVYESRKHLWVCIPGDAVVHYD